ncbi:MAG: hypothetical protein F6K35_24590 [Okeania sp. SIO2H7]|nr:hypothetical protein [Okeania sp. SIO2H7]
MTDAVGDMAAIVKSLNKPKTGDNLTMTIEREHELFISMAGLQNLLETLNDKMAELAKQVYELEGKNQDLKAENAGLKSENTDLKDTVENVRFLSSNRQLEIEGLRKERDFLKGQVSALRSERDEAWSQVALLDGTEIPDDDESEENGESLRPPIPNESESQVPLKKDNQPEVSEDDWDWEDESWLDKDYLTGGSDG